MTEQVSMDSIAVLLQSLMGVIVTLVSVLVAAGIFIATLHQRNSQRSVDEEILLKKQLLKSKFVFSEFFESFKDRMNDQEKIAIFKAIPSVSVSNQYDYDNYKLWHSGAINQIPEQSVNPYDRFVLFPYNMVMAIKGSRTYYITEASVVALNYLSNSKNGNHRLLKQNIESLQAACERYQTAGVHGYYVPTDFVGNRLIRIIVYSLLSVAAIFAALLAKDFQGNTVITLFSFNLEVVNGLFAISITLSSLSLFLILRHIYGFIIFLRNSAQYNGTIFDNFYIYEEDQSVKDPENPYMY